MQLAVQSFNIVNTHDCHFLKILLLTLFRFWIFGCYFNIYALCIVYNSSLHIHTLSKRKFWILYIVFWQLYSYQNPKTTVTLPTPEPSLEKTPFCVFNRWCCQCAALELRAWLFRSWLHQINTALHVLSLLLIPSFDETWSSMSNKTKKTPCWKAQLEFTDPKLQIKDLIWRWR